jgi:hypothetical protein
MFCRTSAESCSYQGLPRGKSLDDRSVLKRYNDIAEPMYPLTVIHVISSLVQIEDRQTGSRQRQEPNPKPPNSEILARSKKLFGLIFHARDIGQKGSETKTKEDSDTGN